MQPSSFFLPPLFFSSLFKLLDPLPLLLGFCWPWNQFLMGTQWPRAEPTCCIQMWPPAIISRLPTLYKHSFNNLSSQLLSTSTFVSSWAAANGNCRKTPLQLQRHRPPEQEDGRKKQRSKRSCALTLLEINGGRGENSNQAKLPSKFYNSYSYYWIH